VEHVFVEHVFVEHVFVEHVFVDLLFLWNTSLWNTFLWNTFIWITEEDHGPKASDAGDKEEAPAVAADDEAESSSSDDDEELEIDVDNIDPATLIKDEADQIYLDTLSEFQREAVLGNRFLILKNEREMKNALRAAKRMERDRSGILSSKKVAIADTTLQCGAATTDSKATAPAGDPTICEDPFCELTDPKTADSLDPKFCENPLCGLFTQERAEETSHSDAEDSQESSGTESDAVDGDDSSFKGGGSEEDESEEEDRKKGVKAASKKKQFPLRPTRGRSGSPDNVNSILPLPSNDQRPKPSSISPMGDKSGLRFRPPGAIPHGDGSSSDVDDQETAGRGKTTPPATSRDGQPKDYHSSEEADDPTTAKGADDASAKEEGSCWLVPVQCGAKRYDANLRMVSWMGPQCFTDKKGWVPVMQYDDWIACPLCFKAFMISSMYQHRITCGPKCSQDPIALAKLADHRKGKASHNVEMRKNPAKKLDNLVKTKQRAKASLNPFGREPIVDRFEQVSLACYVVISIMLISHTFFLWHVPFFTFIICGTVHIIILWNNPLQCFVILPLRTCQSIWPVFVKHSTPLFWSPTKGSPVMREEFSTKIQMVLLQCLCDHDDPLSVGGILHGGKWQDNREFLLQLFDPEQRAIVPHLKAPASRFDSLLETPLSPLLSIPDCVFHHFHHSIKTFMDLERDPFFTGHYTEAIRSVQLKLVQYECEHMRLLFAKMIDTGTYDKKKYTKKKMDVVRENVDFVMRMAKIEDADK
jgi:hypothetical protein